MQQTDCVCKILQHLPPGKVVLHDLKTLFLIVNDKKSIVRSGNVNGLYRSLKILRRNWRMNVQWMLC